MMNKFKLYRLFIVLLGLAQMLMCKTPNENAEIITSSAEFSGFVTAVKPAFGGKYIVYAESHANKIVQKWKITVTKNTRILSKNGESFQQMDIALLQSTDRIQVWFFSKSGGHNFEGTASQIVVTPK